MDANAWGLGLTQEVHKKWLGVKDSSPFFDSGYRVFYSPLIMNPELMVIGYNPGGGVESFDQADAQTIPAQHDYFVEDYHLAKRMRMLFQKMDREDQLKNSIKFNLMFFRSNNMDQWNQLDPDIRKDIEQFCIQKNVEIIRTLKPRVILAEGIATYSQLKNALGIDTSGKPTESKGRTLFIENEGPTYKLLGLIHPSGARVSNDEWQVIAEILSSKI